MASKIMGAKQPGFDVPQVARTQLRPSRLVGPVQRPVPAARLLKHVFDIDMQPRPNCGGYLKIVAAIPERPVIEKIHMHMSLQVRAPPRARAWMTGSFAALNPG